SRWELNLIERLRGARRAVRRMAWAADRKRARNWMADARWLPDMPGPSRGFARVCGAVVSPVEQRLEFTEVGGGKKPRAIVNRRQTQWSRGDELNFVAVILD